MTPDQFLTHLRNEGDRLLEIGRASDLATPLPSMPDWSVGGVIGHTGWVYHYILGNLAAGEPQSRKSVQIPEDEPAGALVDWVAAGLDAQEAYLREHGPDADVWTIEGPGKLGFFHRRMAHESAVHRWDAESALGKPAPIDAALAVDGIDELFEHFVGFRKPDIFAGSGSVHLHATDIGGGEWMIVRNDTGMTVTKEHAKGDVAVRGSASDLLMLMWNRLTLDTGEFEVFGDAGQITAWQKNVKF